VLLDQVLIQSLGFGEQVSVEGAHPQTLMTVRVVGSGHDAIRRAAMGDGGDDLLRGRLGVLLAGCQLRNKLNAPALRGFTDPLGFGVSVVEVGCQC
jgi:hypothetical protein